MRKIDLIAAALLLVFADCKAESPLRRPSLLFTEQIPHLVALLNNKSFFPDSLETMFNTHFTICDTTKKISIWNMWYSRPDSNSGKVYWELHVNNKRDSAMAIIVPQTTMDYPALKKKLRPWTLVEVPAIENYHAQYRHILSTGQSVVATTMENKKVAVIAFIYPTITTLAKK